MLLGVLVNAAAILVGSLVGLLLRRGISEKVSAAVMTGIGLCVAVIGLDGALKTENSLILILSISCGAVVGTLLDIDALLQRFGLWVQDKLTGGKSPQGKHGIAEGFVGGTLLYCVGAMAIVGSLNSGLIGDHSMLFTKSMLDGISSIMLAVSLGMGVALSSVSVFVYQGAIVLLSGLLRPLLSDACITEIGAAGSLLIVVIGTNMIGVTKIKAANFLPAVLFVPLFVWLFSLI